MQERTRKKTRNIIHSFGDRGKRLKLQQFIAKKADALYDKSNLEKTVDPIKQEIGDEGKATQQKSVLFVEEKKRVFTVESQ